MHQSVLLLHTLPDGSSHYDWLIDQPALQIEHRLLAWRCAFRPDSSASFPLKAQRLPDHRAHYLTYQGPIANNRGSVQRIASGHVRSLVFDAHSMDIAIEWTQCTLVYRAELHPQTPERWIFRCQSV